MLRRCLDSLASVLRREDVELVWVDNGSRDGSAAYMAAEWPQAVTELLPENRGVAYARNRGVELAQGKYILFLDDDTEADEDALEALMTYLDTHPEVGIAGCALRDGKGNLQDSFKAYPGLWQKVSNVVRGKLRRSRRQVELPPHVLHPAYIIGACQMIRREVFDRIGLLDVAIFYGPEDADFCLRAHKAGWLTAYLPQVCIRHHWRRITNRRLTSPIARAHARALVHFWIKHRRLF